MNEPSEHQHQVAFVNWVRLNYPAFIIFAIPNGGKRHIKTAMDMKFSGVLPGVPDLIILMPNTKIVFIEMKKQKKSYLSKDQKIFISRAEKLNHIVIVGYGATDASTKFNAYLEK